MKRTLPASPPVVLLVLCLALLLAVTGCATEATPSDAPTPDAPPVADEMVDTTAAATAVPDAASLHPDTLRTNITGLDPVLEAVASRDPQAIADRMALLETACTTAGGLGGPPKCADGVADGTLVSVFPMLEAEGTFAAADDLLQVADSLQIAGLFGIYQVTSDTSSAEAYWPSGDYGIVLSGSGTVPAYTLLVSQGNIVRLIYHLGSSPEEAFDTGRGVILVPPLQ
jgi:hypothetical protein